MHLPDTSASMPSAHSKKTNEKMNEFFQQIILKTQRLFGLSSRVLFSLAPGVGEAANAARRPRRHHTQKLFGLSSLRFIFFGVRCW
jgi:hypothetical protein